MSTRSRNSPVRPTSAPQNFAEAAKTCEEQLNNSFMTEANVPRLVHILQALLNYQIKNYDKAIEFGNRAVKAGTRERGG